jgi:IS5 family transposase
MFSPMRKKTEACFSTLFQTDDEKELSIVKEYHDQYKHADQILSTMPEVLQRAHDDFAKLSHATDREREADFTSENLLRAIIVMGTEGLTLRETTLRIYESEFLQKFCRLTKKNTIDYTLLDRAFNALEPETWEIINRCFAIRMKHEGKIDIAHIRSDTTVTETNIHYPTDSSLLWDVYRTLFRLIKQVRSLGFQVPSMRFHTADIKKLHLNVTRYSNSKTAKTQRKVKRWLKDLIDRVDWAVGRAIEVQTDMLLSSDEAVQHIGQVLGRFIPTMVQIVEVALRRWKGETVPNEEKVFSLFEEHTELIQRGRRGKPIEFGHSILFSETKEKFITDYLVFETRPSDSTLLPVVMDRHEDIFGEKIKNLAADKGFRPKDDTFEDLAEEMEFLAVPSRMCDFGDVMMRMYQSFRAGIEGTISCLKRAYRLSRCYFRGFKGFCRSVGSAVFCHNLSVMARAARKSGPP